MTQRRIGYFLLGVFLGCMVAFLPGCGTLSGLAQDVSAMSNGIANAMARDDDRRLD